MSLNSEGPDRFTSAIRSTPPRNPFQTPSATTMPLPGSTGEQTPEAARLHSPVAQREGETGGSATTCVHSEAPPPNSTLLPPFTSREYTHLPTPQSPNNMGSYIGAVPFTPESPLPPSERELYGSMASVSLAQRVARATPLADIPSKSGQIMTPDSSPMASRSSPPPKFTTGSRPFVAASETTIPQLSSFGNEGIPSGTSRPGPYQISPPATASPEAAVPSKSRLSSPFVARMSEGSSSKAASPMPTPQSSPAPSPGQIYGQATSAGSHPSQSQSRSQIQPMHVDDVFSSGMGSAPSAPIAAPSAARSPVPPAISTSSGGLPGGELERIRQQMLEESRAAHEAAESRRPDYFVRAKRPLTPTPDDVREAEERDMGGPGVGITMTPLRGRRIKLFQETSEESFEESLMAGGYGRYRTVDWQPEQTLPVIPGPSNPAPPPEEETIPDEKELRRRKRLAAFREPLKPASGTQKLFAVEIEGKGRVLMDAPPEEVLDSPMKKRGPGPTIVTTPSFISNARRKKKGASAAPEVVPVNPKDRGGSATPASSAAESGADGPNWADTEFPWSVRIEERQDRAKQEDEERMKWIEKFLDRSSDDEDEKDDDDDEIQMLPGTGWGQPYEPPPIRRGRGKMIPLQANPSLPPAVIRRRNAYFSSNSADARAALMAKKLVRTLSLRRQRRRKIGDDDESEDDEVVCICRGRDDGRELVQCDACGMWYHLHCIGLHDSSELGPEEEMWFCADCTGRPRYRAQTPELAPSSEPMRAPVDDPLFYQGSYMQDSPGPSWNTRLPPRTPTRGEDIPGNFSSSGSYSSWNAGPSTPLQSAQGVRVYTTPGMFDGQDEFDPTSTPSRGMKFGGSFTPKNSQWGRPNALFQTPSRLPGRGSIGRPLFGSGGTAPSSEDVADPPPAFGPYRPGPSYDDTPVRHAKPDRERDRPNLPPPRRLLDSPSASGRLPGLAHLGLEDSPVMHGPGLASRGTQRMHDLTESHLGQRPRDDDHR